MGPSVGTRNAEGDGRPGRRVKSATPIWPARVRVGDLRVNRGHRAGAVPGVYRALWHRPGGEMRLGGEVALVHGATRGMGRRIAERFASEGAKVVCTGRDETRGLQVEKAILEAGGTAQ